MQIVIEINEDLYNHVKSSYRTGIGTKAGVDLGFAVAKGKPIPKGHGKLIDSNVLWDAYQDLGQDFCEALDFAEANAVIEEDEDGQDGR